MRGFNALFKKEVVSLKDNRIIGSLKDICFDYDGRLIAIIIKSKNVLNTDRIYKTNNVKSFTKDCIELKDATSYEKKLAQEFLFAGDVIGLVVRSRYQILGICDNIYFNFRDRRVTGISMSKGFLLDVYDGTQIIPFEDLKVNKKFILCPPQKKLKVYNGGIRNILKREE